jgi:hypothetical protein
MNSNSGYAYHAKELEDCHGAYKLRLGRVTKELRSMSAFLGNMDGMGKFVAS